MVVFLLRKLSWYLLVPWKLVLRKEAFWSVPVREEHTNCSSVQSKWSALKLYIQVTYRSKQIVINYLGTDVLVRVLWRNRPASTSIRFVGVAVVPVFEQWLSPNRKVKT